VAKIYIVTSGCYSDYRINHVFSTRELADRWIGERAGEDYSAEEYEIDPIVDFTENIKTSIGVDMNKDGSVRNIRDDGYGAYYKEARVRLWLDYRDTPTPYLETVILTRDRESAIKTTNDIRIRLLALDRWTVKNKRCASFQYSSLEEIV